MSQVRILSEAEVRSHLDPVQLIASLESAFRDRFPQIHMPLRTHMNLAEGVFLTMPCYDPTGSALGMKLVMVRHHPEPADQRVQSTYLLFDRISATPRLILSARHLTEVRTAATSALATKFLARADAQTLGIFGVGRQARAHLEILPLVRRFTRALICGRDPFSTRDFAQQMSVTCSFPVEPADASACAVNSDVLCLCTTSASPLFDGHLLRPGTHLNLVGSFQPHTREVDSYTMQHATVAVDTYSGALSEAGDILLPMSEGVIDRDHIRLDLHQLVSQGSIARKTSNEITIFKSVGCALEDLVAAELVQASLA